MIFKNSELITTKVINTHRRPNDIIFIVALAFTENVIKEDWHLNFALLRNATNAILDADMDSLLKQLDTLQELLYSVEEFLEDCKENEVIEFLSDHWKECILGGIGAYFAISYSTNYVMVRNITILTVPCTYFSLKSTRAVEIKEFYSTQCGIHGNLLALFFYKNFV